VYAINDFFSIILRGVQPIIFDQSLEGMIIGVEITQIQLMKFLVQQHKIQPYLECRNPDILLKGTFAQWIEFCYHKGSRTSIEVSGDIGLLQILRADCERVLNKLQQKALELQPTLIISLLDQITHYLKESVQSTTLFASQALYQEQERLLFEMYYQIERMDQQLNKILSCTMR
jgi:hypothetical protein